MDRSGSSGFPGACGLQAAVVAWLAGSCGAPQPASVGPEPAGPEAGTDAGAAPPESGPAAAEPDGGGAPETGTTSGTAREVFRGVLAALESGSARTLRDLVPAGGTLVLTTHICRKPVYGIGTCRDERSEADRRRVRDDQLATWQDLVRRARAARPEFSVATVDTACEDGDDDGVRCTAVVPLGSDACRGDMDATVTATLREDEGVWRLVELGYEEDILLCR